MLRPDRIDILANKTLGPPLGLRLREAVHNYAISCRTDYVLTSTKFRPQVPLHHPYQFRDVLPFTELEAGFQPIYTRSTYWCVLGTSYALVSPFFVFTLLAV
jgi:hypothetical protein